jgi:protein-S-isoprenylcysteine O-methyltransferase Ste14
MAGVETSSRGAARPMLDRAALIDTVTRVGVILWFATVAAALTPRFTAGLAALHGGDALAVIQLIASGCLVCFYLLIVALTLLRGRPLAKSPGWRPRVEAAIGGFLIYALPVLPSSRLGAAGHAVSVLLMAGGIVLALCALTQLGRSFSIMAEARGLVTGGPYAIVRHPLYLAEGIANLGACLQFAVLPALALFALQSLFQVRRMLNEEAVLRRTFPEYAGYMQHTARLFPGLW